MIRPLQTSLKNKLHTGFFKKLGIFFLFLFIVFQPLTALASTTSWKGTLSTAWNLGTNWTNGVPSASSDVIIGDANFTGLFQPTINVTSALARSLTVGGSVASTLTTGSNNITISGDVTINSNGTITHNSTNASRIFTVDGNWIQTGTYTAANANATVVMDVANTITGSGPFQKLTINDTTTILSNITVNSQLFISGKLDPGTFTVSGTGSIGNVGFLLVNASTFTGNYNHSGGTENTELGVVEYTGGTQTVSSTVSYDKLRISGSGTRTADGNLSIFSALEILAGTLDLSTFTVMGQVEGGADFTLASGTTLKIGGTQTMPVFGSNTINNASTIEYSGGDQTIANDFTYGKLTTSGSGTKTLVGNVTANAIVTLGATRLADAGFTLTAKANVVNNTIHSGTGKILLTGASAVHTLSGSGSYTNLELDDAQGATVSSNDLTLNGAMTLTSGTMTTSSNSILVSNTGSFSQTSGTLSGTVNYNGTSQTVSGITYDNLTTSTSGTKTAGAAVTVNGIFTIGSSTTFDASSFSHSFGGNVSNSGTLTGSTSTITVSGTSASITGAGTYNFNNLTVTGAGVAVSATSNLGIGGNLSTTGAGTFTHTSGSTGTITMSGTSKTISGTGIAMNALTASGSISTSSSFSIASNFNTSGSFTASSGTITFNGTSLLSGSPALNNVILNGTSLQLAGSSILGIAGTFTLTSGTFDVTTTTPNTVNYNGTTQTVTATTYDNLTIGASGTKTAGGALTVNRNLTVSAGTFAASTFTHSVAGNISNAGTIDGGTSSITMSGSSKTISGAGTTTFNNFTVSGSVTANQNIGVTGNFTNNGTFTIPSNTITFSGSSDATLGGSTSPTSLSSVMVNKTSAKVTLAIDISTVATLNVSGGTLDLGSFTVSQNSGTLTVGSGATLKIGGSNSLPTFNAYSINSASTIEFNGSGSQTITAQSYGNLTSSGSGGRTLSSSGTISIAGTFTAGSNTYTTTGSTVDFNGSGSQTIPALLYNNLTSSSSGARVLASSGTIGVAGTFTKGTNSYTTTGSTVNFNGSTQSIPALTYNNLTISGSGTKTASGDITATGDVTLSAGSFVDGGNTITVNGNIANSIAHTGTGKILLSGGSAAHTLSGTGSYTNLELNDANGATLSADLTVNGTLTFTSGNVTTSSSKVIISSTGSLSRTSGHIIGNLQKNIATGPTSKTFELGTASAYLPVDIAFGSVSSAGNLTIKTTTGEHPNIGTSLIRSDKDVNRYWTMTNSGIAFTNYSATFNFAAGDVDGIATPASFIAESFNGGSWTLLTTGTKTSTSTQVTGATSFGDVALGEQSDNPVPTTTSLTTASKNVGTSAFTDTVNGTNFVFNSVVKFNGSDRTTTYISGTQLSFTIQTGDMTTAGTFNITVFNPSPAGGTSNAQTFTVNNLTPTTTSISLTSKNVASSAYTDTVNGTNFVSNSMVRFGGSDRTTTFVSATKLLVQILTTDMDSAGTFNITVFNPTPGGGTSNAQTFTVNNNTPATTSLAIASKNLNSSSFSDTVNGSNFVYNSTVRLGGSDRTTTFISASQLAFQIVGSDMDTAGTYSITVFNPTPGGGTSNAQTFTVNNLTPSTTSISPNSKNVGDAAFADTVNGTNFVYNSVVRVNGSDRTTTFVTSTKLIAQFVTGDMDSAGTFNVTVFNPTPGGGTSGAQTFTVNNNTPVTSSIFPDSRGVGSGQFTLVINGSNFVYNSVVRFEGTDRTTTFISAAQLQATILVTDQDTAGTFSISVFNPTPGGGTSNTQGFTIGNPVPTTTGISPTIKTVGASAFTDTISGTNFVLSSVARVNGNNRTTTYISDTQIGISILATDLDSAGNDTITVFNGTPGGGTSNPQILLVNNVTPSSASLAIDTKNLYDAAFYDTINGSSFVYNSTVQFNGVNRTTVFISSTKLAAQILASDMDTAGTFSLTVVNPAPGGGTSGSQILTVNNPTAVTTSISPTQKNIGDVAFTMNVSGHNFVYNSVVKINGSSRTTTFVDSTHLDAAILASDMNSIGTFNITAFNPAPGGGTSNSQTFTVLAGSISGKVYTDVGADSLTAGDPVISGWKVYVNGGKTDSTTTNGTGDYSFSGLSSGTYIITIALPSGRIQTKPTAPNYTINLTSGQDITGNDFAIYQYGTISGLVYLDVNGNAIQDLTTDSGASGWRVRLIKSSVIVDSALSNASGVYSFGNILPGNYTISEVQQNGFTQTLPVSFGSYLAVVSSGSALTGYDFGNYSGSAKYRTISASTAIVAKTVKMKYKVFTIVKKPKTTVTRLTAYPNLGTVLENTFKGIGKLGTTFLGVAQAKDSAKYYAWIFYKKAGDLQKLYTAPHHGKAAPLRTINVNGKTVKLSKAITAKYPTFDNTGIEQGVLFRLNIIASDLGVTVDTSNPTRKFGDLLLDTNVTLLGKQLKGYRLRDVAKYFDSINTYFVRFHNDDVQDTLNHVTSFVDNILSTLNNRFSATMDSTNYIVDSLGIVVSKNSYAVKLAGLKTAAQASIVREAPAKATPVQFVADPGYQELPTEIALNQNYPNPFNPATTISFGLVEPSIVTLKVYNVLGQEVKTLINNESYDAGENEVQFDASSLSSGVYFYRIDVNGGAFVQTKKLVLMK